jgi:hypothetical protein
MDILILSLLPERQPMMSTLCSITSTVAGIKPFDPLPASNSTQSRRRLASPHLYIRIRALQFGNKFMEAREALQDADPATAVL